MNCNLFSNANPARTVTLAPVLVLVAERYAACPYPGMIAEDCARSAISIGTRHADMLEAVVRSQGVGELTCDQVAKFIPQDCRDLVDRWLYGGMRAHAAEQCSTMARYVSQDGKGFDLPIASRHDCLPPSPQEAPNIDDR